MKCANCNKPFRGSELYFDTDSIRKELKGKVEWDKLKYIDNNLKNLKFKSLYDVYDKLAHFYLQETEIKTIVNNARGETPDLYDDNICKSCRDLLNNRHFYKGKIITEGTMFTTEKRDIPIPLKYTEVRVNIAETVAEVEVSQKFYNDLDRNIEAVYVFPLSKNSAVTFMEIRIGERVIKGEIKEREEAKRVYEEAKEESKKAALLEQERPDIFTMSVANIEKKQEIIVNIKYYETVKYEENEYEFVFPMTIMPRYSTSLMERISPFAKAPSPEDRTIKIFINLDTGFEIGNIYSPGHRINIKEKSKFIREVSLAKDVEIPNKDFILKYSPKGEEFTTSISCYKEKDKPGKFMVNLIPKFDYGPEEIIKREVIFVLDRSSSMMGVPMEEAKKSLKEALRTLRAGDIFNIITFNIKVDSLSDNSLEFNENNLSLANSFIDNTYAWDGTDILLVLEEILSIRERQDYLRQIVFLTDGGVENEDEIFKKIMKKLGKTRIFTFGIGPAVNRYLLEKMALSGRGTVQFITRGEDIKEGMERFLKETSFPALTDISLEWNGIKVSDLYPMPIPDLYFGQTIQIFGRFYGSGKGTLVLNSNTLKDVFRQDFDFELPEEDLSHPVIETIWARKRIDHLLDLQRKNPKETSSIRDEIIGLGLNYNLMTPYTSLVAVEKNNNKQEIKEEILRIDVPSLLPRDLNKKAFVQSTKKNSADIRSSVADFLIGSDSSSTFDMMPGKQMAIDRDGGFLNSEEKQKREREIQEYQKYQKYCREIYIINLGIFGWIWLIIKAPFRIIFRILKLIISLPLSVSRGNKKNIHY